MSNQPVGRVEGQGRGLSVADQGVGIPPKEIPHLCERFSRPHASQQREGLGLGLYSARLIEETHGGRVLVESEVGRERDFSFSLPLAE
ncbi:MAG: sensor histidine kinase [Chloroflexota bacterium]